MKKTKSFLSVLAIAVLVLALTACGSNQDSSTPTTADKNTETTTTTTSSDTTTTTTETTTSVPEAAKPVILVVSFGTSYAETRELTIGAIENEIQSKFPEYEVRRAFTSNIIKDIMQNRDGIHVDDVEEAMERLIADGVSEVIIQPTHVMNGFEYDDVVEDVKAYKDKFETIKFGKPLLSSEKDFLAVVDAIGAEYAEYDDGETAFVFVGHGTEHAANSVYSRLQDYFKEADKAHYLIGTVEAEPEYEDVLEALKETGRAKVVLAPLMVVAGDHANNDILGEEEDSWKVMLEDEGFEIIPALRGLGEYADIRDIYVSHVQKAIDTPTIIGPVTGEHLNAGVYEGIEVSSSSSMFKIVDASVNVADDGIMTATITLSGKGYKALFLGTGEKALEAMNGGGSEVIELMSFFIPFVENEEGMYTYTFELEAFDAPLDCAAFSTKKEQWYDRVIQFSSDSLPNEAFK